MVKIDNLIIDYENFHNKNFNKRWLSYYELKNYIKDFKNKNVIGKSFLGKDIYKLKIGEGENKILIISQMHGNETTGTRSIINFLEIIKLNNYYTNFILKNATIFIIPMLNPDGANIFNRRNIIGIDINRDFIDKKAIETQNLINDVLNNDYDIIFNLHDQRSIFNVKNTCKPSLISFLSPAFDNLQSINNIRLESINIIYQIYKSLSNVIEGHISRFEGSFYPNAIGDNLVKLGYKCILIESGHLFEDYERIISTKITTISLILGIISYINRKSNNNYIKQYLKIPENDTKFYDVILRNVVIKYNKNLSVVDLGLIYHEFLDNKINNINRLLYIKEIGNLNGFYAHRDINCNFKICSNYPLLIDNLANFKIGEIIIKKGILL